MAAFAALVSLMHTIEQIQQHPRPPISLDKQHVQSLTQKVTFLQEFLEGPYYMQLDDDSNEAHLLGLETLIAVVAHVAEDIIDSHIVDQIHAASTHQIVGSISPDLSAKDMGIAMQEAMRIKEKMGSVHHHPQRASSISASASTVHNISIGFDDLLIEVMDKLIGGKSDRQILPIVGMGGIGKTTFARTIYQNQLIVQHFYIRAWVTISQEYIIKEILLKLLQNNGENLSHMNEYELGDTLYKSLCGRRYLIVIDDIWNIQAWDQLKRFLPRNNNGSRIMLTTRLVRLGFQVSGSPCLNIRFLDANTSWDLLCRNVFRKEDCPAELEAIGKKIAKNCKGLPLSIVVVGGILANSEKTPEHWEYILENLNSIVSLEDDDHCLKILHWSYKQLPTHLKPCFLHLGIFPEDYEICLSDLIKLWVSEGFLKPIGGKSLEEVAKVYLEELMDRNIILVERLSSRGKVKTCKVHDLMRDLCLGEARSQVFFSSLRRISFHRSISDPSITSHVLESLSDARSLYLTGSFEEPPSPLGFGLRVYSYIVELGDRAILNDQILDSIFEQVNLRCIVVRTSWTLERLPSSFTRLWNLQTLIIRGLEIDRRAPSEIWMMHQLRHVIVRALQLPDPLSGCTNDFVLENLQTLICKKF